MGTFQVRVSAYKSINKQEAIAKTKHFMAQIVNGQNKIQNHTMDWIIERMLSGYTINFSEVPQKYIMAIDIDNKVDRPVTYQDIVSYLLSKKIKPAAVLTTLSATIEHPRYHFIFAFNRAIIDIIEYKNIIKAIISMINDKFGKIADTTCSSAYRLFYPCKSLVYKKCRETIDIYKLNKSLLHLNPKADSVINFNNLAHELSILQSLPHDNRLADIHRPDNNLDIKRCSRCPDLFILLPKINLSKILDVPFNCYFNDIIEPGKKYRAIIKFNDGKYYYYCYACKQLIKALDIFGLIQFLYKIKPKDILSFLSSKLAISTALYDNKEMLELIKNYRARLTLIKEYTHMPSIMSRNNNGLYDLLVKILDRVEIVSKSVDITKTCNQFWITKLSLGLDSNQVYKKLQMLYALGFINRVKECNYSLVTKFTISKSIHKTNDVHIITIPQLTMDRLAVIEQLAKTMIDNNISENNITSIGKPYAPLKNIINILAIKKDISKQRYILFNDFVESLASIIPLNKKDRATKLRTLMPEIVKHVGVTYTTVTKSMINKYHITDKVYPKITKIILFEIQ